MSWFRKRVDAPSEADRALKEAVEAHNKILEKEKEITPLLDRMTKTATGNGIYDQVLLTLRER